MAEGKSSLLAGPQWRRSFRDKLVSPDGVNFWATDLSGADLFRANFCEAFLIGTDLIGARLGQAWLTDANLHRANLSADELVEAYLVWLRPDPAHGIPARKRSWKSAEVHAINRLAEYFGGSKLTALTSAAVENYRTWRKETPFRFGRPVLPGTVNRGLAVFRGIWNLAGKGIMLLQGGIPRENPVSQVTLEPVHDARDRVFSGAEVAKLLAVAPIWAQPMIELADQTGMRRGGKSSACGGIRST